MVEYKPFFTILCCGGFGVGDIVNREALLSSGIADIKHDLGPSSAATPLTTSFPFFLRSIVCKKKKAIAWSMVITEKDSRNDMTWSYNYEC